MGTAQTASASRMSTFDLFVRGILVVNFALLVLSFVPAFSGTGREPGAADRLLGDYRLDGWRADLVWMWLSTAWIFCVCILRAYLVIVVGGPSWPRARGARRTTSVLCWAWLACFVFLYVPYTFAYMFG